jgi:hypothetical protein
MFPHDELRLGRVENSGRLKNTIEVPVLKPLISSMLRNVVHTNQQTCGIFDAHDKLGESASRPLLDFGVLNDNLIK